MQRGILLNDVNLKAAFEDYQKAIEIRTRLVEKEGRWKFAVDLAKSYQTRSIVFIRLRRMDAALKDGEKVIDIYMRLVEQKRKRELTDTLITLLNSHASLYATCPNDTYRNGVLAVRHATKACQLSTWSRWDLLATLAAANAEVSDYEKAEKLQRQAIELAPSHAKEELEANLKLYKSGRPHRQPASQTDSDG